MSQSPPPPAERTSKRARNGTSSTASPPPKRTLVGYTRPAAASECPTVPNIYAMIRRIPEGKVASYGDIAKYLGSPRHVRVIGAALKLLSASLSSPTLPQAPLSPSAGADAILPPPLPNPEWVPWHRVVSTSGVISPRSNMQAVMIQADWLTAEGIEVRDGPRAGVDGPGAGIGANGVPVGADAFGLGGVEGGRVSMSVYRWSGP